METRLDDLDYIQKINEALNSHPAVIRTFRQILAFINSLYKHIEPEFHEGRIVLFKTIDPKDRPISSGKENYFFDLGGLLNEKTNDIIIQINDDEPDLLWRNKQLELTDLSSQAIVYEYFNGEEKFYAGRKEIKLVKRVNSSSNYATYFSDLRQALNEYKQSHIRHSSCSTFKNVWFDQNRVFFKNAPESEMQRSLSDFLKNRLSFKGPIEIAREHNTDTSNPVDIRVLWKMANRSAIIEIKWLGKSMNNQKKITLSHTNSRAVQGADQLRKYLDKDRQSNPTNSTKGILVVIDGRRRSPDEMITSISRKDGFFYQDKELEFGNSKEYHKTRKDFEEPIRMFAEPICQD